MFIPSVQRSLKVPGSATKMNPSLVPVKPPPACLFSGSCEFTQPPQRAEQLGHGKSLALAKFNSNYYTDLYCNHSRRNEDILRGCLLPLFAYQTVGRLDPKSWSFPRFPAGKSERTGPGTSRVGGELVSWGRFHTILICEHSLDHDGGWDHVLTELFS